MVAIVEIAGIQHKVTPAEKIFVPRLAQETGSTVAFDRVLLVSDDNGVKVGTPTLSGVTVQAKILGHAKDDTVIVFKKKRRKGYRVKRGHRQQYTQIEITQIG